MYIDSDTQRIAAAHSPKMQHLPVEQNRSETEKRSFVSTTSCFFKSFASALVMLALVQHTINFTIWTKYIRDENHTFTKRIILPTDDLSSFRGVLNSVERTFPRTVFVMNQDNEMNLTDVPYTQKFVQNSIGQSETPDTPELVEGYNMNVCKPMYDWQSKSFPSCNMMHEVLLPEMKFLASGTLRLVFELTENIDGSENKFVYKNIDYGGKYGVDSKRINQERKDALILERTTRAEFTPSVYIYCGTAVIVDHAPRDLKYYNEKRLERNLTVSPLDRLKISIHIASGVADVHSADFIHNDLHEQQFLYQDGLFKLNDFNYAKPIYIDKNTSETCSLSIFKMGLFGRSLEELQYKVDKKRSMPVKPDKIDVWMMGNLLYTILTDLQVWDKELRSDADVKLATAKRLVNGETPRFPHLVQESNDPAHLAMKNALNMAWSRNSEQRSSARSIANYMIGELRRITGEVTPDLRVNFP